MRRRLFNFAAVASLAFCLATIGLWVRSYAVPDLLTRKTTHRFIVFGSDRGALSLGIYDIEYDIPAAATNPSWEWAAMRTDQGGGFGPAWWGSTGSFSSPWGSTASYGVWWVRHWIVSTAMALLPIGWMIEKNGPGRRRRQSLCAGLCPECGYDLRASKDRCPECGIVFTPARGP